MVTQRQLTVRAASLGYVRVCYITEALLVQFGRNGVSTTPVSATAAAISALIPVHRISFRRRE
jgi:hypothetical protein